VKLSLLIYSYRLCKTFHPNKRE